MISANGGLPAHRYTPQVTPRWPRGSEPASMVLRPSFTAHVSRHSLAWQLLWISKGPTSQTLNFSLLSVLPSILLG